MLRSSDGLRRNTVLARDGEIGHIHDALFDDERWTLRYLVVDTRWIGGARVLVSPMAVEEADGGSGVIRVDLSVEQVERSPSIDTDAPVHRQHERRYAKYYGWAPYWGWGGLWGAYGSPVALRSAPAPTLPPEEAAVQQHEDPHLRSVREVTGYQIEATDGDIGHVEDLLFEEESWAVRYLVVDTRNWWPGKKVLLSPEWAQEFRWEDRTARVGLRRDEVRAAPEWHPTDLINREYEVRLYDAYGRSGYWERDASRPRGVLRGPGAIY